MPWDRADRCERSDSRRCERRQTERQPAGQHCIEERRVSRLFGILKAETCTAMIRLSLGGFRWDRRRDRRDAFPRTVHLYPSVDGALAMNVWLSLFDSFDTENSHSHGAVSVHLHFVGFVDGLRGLEVRRLDSGEIFLLIRERAVAVEGDHGVS